MIADLFQLHQRAQHQTAATQTFGTINLGKHLLHHLVVQGDLLVGQRNMFARLNQRRQIADDIQVSLQTAQHKRPHQIAQLLGAIAIAMALDWNSEAALEIRQRSKVTRRAEFHDRPQFGQAIFNRRTCERNAMIRLNGANCRGLLGWWILNVLRLV